jgi:hypothetical protein
MIYVQPSNHPIIWKRLPAFRTRVISIRKSYSAELSRDPARPENISFNADYQHTHQTALGIEIKPHNQSGRGPDGNNTPPHEDTPTDGDPVSLLNGEELLAIEDGTSPGPPGLYLATFLPLHSRRH